MEEFLWQNGCILLLRWNDLEAYILQDFIFISFYFIICIFQFVALGILWLFLFFSFFAFIVISTAEKGSALKEHFNQRWKFSENFRCPQAIQDEFVSSSKHSEQVM